ncbi:MAG: response regulator transcription factor [Parabacteroides sp.]
MKLLIVEDERQLSDSIVSYLSQDDYRCEQVFSCGEALVRIGVYEYDCILLDLMLPGGSGLDILRQIKQQAPQTGVIIVSAKDSLDDKVAGLRIGADDYLAKPFHLPELSMRIFALMRRKQFTATNLLRSGALTIDLLAKKARVPQMELDLTKSEYELLLFLIENRRRVVSKSALAEHLSGDMADMLDDFNFVYAHIKNLKAKLAAVGMTDCIKTYYGTGYKWLVEDETEK